MAQLHARYIPTWGPAIESALGAYHEMARLKLARRAQEETERRNRETDARAHRTADRLELRDTVDYEFKQGENIRLKKQRAKEYIDRGDFEGAKAELADVPFIKDGQIQRGLKMEEVGAPAAPVKPAVPDELANNLDFMVSKAYRGGLTGDPAPVSDEPPEEASKAEKMQAWLSNKGPDLNTLIGAALAKGREERTRAAQSDPEAQTAAREYQGDMEKYNTAAAAHPQAVEQYNQNRKFRISGGPAGSEEVVSEVGARQGVVSNRNRDADEFATSVAPDPNPWVQKYAPTLTELIRGGGMDRKEAAKYLFMLRGQDMSDAQKEEAMKQAMARAKVMASASRARTAATGGLKEEQFGNQKFQQLLTNFGFKGDVSLLRSLSETATNMTMRNSALDVLTGAQFAKQAQGAGVLTDKDYDRFWGAIGAGEERVADWFDRAVNGQMGEKKRRIVLDAIALRVKHETKRLAMVRERADAQFSSEDWYGPMRDSYFGWLPDDTDPADDPRGKFPGAAKKKSTTARADELGI